MRVGPVRDMALAFVNLLHYFVLVFNGSDLLAVTGRDKGATWRSTNVLGWSKPRLLHELQNGRQYRTFPPGISIDWERPLYAGPPRRTDQPAHESRAGTASAAHSRIPPGDHRNSKCGTARCNHCRRHRRTHQRPRQCPRHDKGNDPPARTCRIAYWRSRRTGKGDPPGRDKLHEEVKNRLNWPVGRDHVDRIWKKVAPQWVNPRGRKRKSAK